MMHWQSLLAQQAPAGDAAAPWESPQLWLAAGGVAVFVLFLVVRQLRRKEAPARAERSPLHFDLNTLTSDGPPPGKPYLEFYSVPVRLALIVFAPVGREGRVPGDEQLPEVMEALLPGMMKVLTAHQPKFVRWPAQLSSQGFAHAFFNNVPLPGDHGRGTPWCSVAGKVELPTGQFLVGLVCCAAAPNSLGEVTTKHAAGWPEVIRVKSEVPPTRKR